MAKTSTSSSSAKPAATPEKRLKRHRSKPTNAISARIDRATTQRLYLISASQPTTCSQYGGPSITLNVLGSTGNVYDVTLSKIPSCNCPDHAKGNLCKHLLFALIKVVGLPTSSPLVYQAAYITQELDTIIEMLQNRAVQLQRGGVAAAAAAGNILANEAVRNCFQDQKKGNRTTDHDHDAATDSTKRHEIQGADCPICFDDLGGMANLDQLTFCQTTCGTNFHSDCIKMWTRQAEQARTPTCPACRQPWTDVKTGGHIIDVDADDGYANLGDLQGQSRVRDTSTYHSYDWRERYKKRRRY
jgi:hypothetical protein